METKVCKKCNKEKNFNQFGTNKSLEDGKQSYCISCTKVPIVGKAENVYKKYLERAGMKEYYKRYMKVN